MQKISGNGNAYYRFDKKVNIWYTTVLLFCLAWSKLSFQCSGEYCCEKFTYL